MSYTNEQLTESLKNNQYETLSELLNVIKEMIKDGSDMPLSATNEQIIVAKYKLSNIKELYQRLNSESSNDDIKQTVYKSVSSNQNKEHNKEQLKEEILNNDKYLSDFRIYVAKSGFLLNFTNQTKSAYTYMYAEFARQLFDEEAYYKIILQEDVMVKKVLELK